MARKYKRKQDSRTYRNYSQETLEKCLLQVLDGKISANKASKKYKIPKGTIMNRIHGKHGKSTGGQTLLTQGEEKNLVSGLMMISTIENDDFIATVLSPQLVTVYYLIPLIIFTIY